jgi:molecular chaperone GrpE
MAEAMAASGGTESEAGAAGAAGALDELTQLRQRLETAEAAAGAAREQYLRSMAELENVRKRAERDVQNAHRYALERFAGELLNVRDTLELAVKSAASADARSLAEGQEATLRLLAKAFEKFDIVRIEPAGAAFDPGLHEAVLMQESAEAAPGTVLQVVQCGYQLNGRLLRPARVTVARAPGS